MEDALYICVCMSLTFCILCPVVCLLSCLLVVSLLFCLPPTEPGAVNSS